MGFLDKLVSVLGLRKKEANVLVVGLDNSGLLQCERWVLVVRLRNTWLEIRYYFARI